MSTIDYMVAAYGPYSASGESEAQIWISSKRPALMCVATGGNGLARDFLAGIAALYSDPCTLATLAALPSTGSIYLVPLLALLYSCA